MIKGIILSDLLDSLMHKPSRLQHVYGVRDTALNFGKKFKLDLKFLEIASLLHDMTKYYTLEENKVLIDGYFENTEEIYQQYNEFTLHAFSAYTLAKIKYNITNTEILNSIMNHTVGRPNMSIYEKIIFVSDYIEPNRTYESCVKVRKMAETSLDLAVYTAIDDSIKFYEKENSKIPLIAYEAREFYKNLLEEQND